MKQNHWLTFHRDGKFEFDYFQSQQLRCNRTHPQQFLYKMSTNQFVIIIHSSKNKWLLNLTLEIWTGLLPILRSRNTTKLFRLHRKSKNRKRWVWRKMWVKWSQFFIIFLFTLQKIQILYIPECDDCLSQRQWPDLCSKLRYNEDVPKKYWHMKQFTHSTHISSTSTQCVVEITYKLTFTVSKLSKFADKSAVRLKDLQNDVKWIKIWKK